MADEGKKPSFDRSLALTERLHRLIPGGAHTYAKGDDQYPADTPPILVRGEGARVWDVDGNEMLGYGMGSSSRQSQFDTIYHEHFSLKDEIMKQMSSAREWDGRFVVPIPMLQIFD